MTAGSGNAPLIMNTGFGTDPTDDKTNGRLEKLIQETVAAGGVPMRSDFVLEGEVIIPTLGKGLSLKEGADGRMGVATLAVGTATVLTAAMNTGDRVILTRQVAGGTLGELSLGTVVDATSFVINSSNAADTSQIFWMIVKPTAL